MTASLPQKSSLLRALGPGLLFASAAVGVSHLVQSTRAGAEHGLAMGGIIILANVMKYPAFRYGAQYAAATGTSLLEGYRKLGPWALWLYGILTLATMFTVQAAVTLVTAGLAVAVFQTSLSLHTVSALLLAICAVLLGVGQYKWLDLVSKGLIAILTVTTLLATALALPRIDAPLLPFFTGPDVWTAPTLLATAALVGWMPSAVDVSVWQSLWTLSRGRDQGSRLAVRDVLTDFHIGYVGTTILALCFMIMGAGVMFGSGATLADSAGGFANQVVSMYATTLGEWMRPVVGAAALAVMFSTTLTVADGFPRALAALRQRIRGPEEPYADETKAQRVDYAVWLVLLSLGGLLIIVLASSSLRWLVDLATTLSFLTAPMLSALNHLVMHQPSVPAESRPSEAIRRFSLVCVAAQAVFAAGYIYVRFFLSPA
jgi:Mn2+/Fe2+ NRAMP family transporter